MAKRKNDGGTATLEVPPIDPATVPVDVAATGPGPAVTDAPPVEPTVEPRVEPDPGHVGLPVQFCIREGEVIPARLQRRPRIDARLWDVKVSLNGTQGFHSQIVYFSHPEITFVKEGTPHAPDRLYRLSQPAQAVQNISAPRRLRWAVLDPWWRQDSFPHVARDACL